MTPNENDRIFVQIPSYRDRECQWTVKDLFEKARYPERIFVGICWQTFPDRDQDCFAIPYPIPEQVRVVEFDASESRGLCWARSEAQSLWRGEEWTLQIDSHMRFVSDWDLRMLEMIGACDSPAPVVTVYPAGYEPPGELKPRQGHYVQAIKKIAHNGLPVYTARPVPKGVPVRHPIPTAAVAGGFLFGPARMIEAVPADPAIYFNGEEPNLAVRLWTHGFDLFSPDQEVIYHYYLRKESARPWNDFKDEAGPRTRATLRRLTQLWAPERVAPEDATDLGRFGLGTERSLAEYEEFAGLSHGNRTLAGYARHFPYVANPEVISFMVRESELRVSPRAHLFLLEEEGFLFSEVTGELFHLNIAATLCWTLLEQGADFEDLLELMVKRGVGDRRQADEYLTRLITHWQGHFLLAGTEETAEQAIDLEREPHPVEIAEEELEDPVQWMERRYRILDQALLLRYPDVAVEASVHPLLLPLEAPSGADQPGQLAMRVQRTTGGELVAIDEAAEEVVFANRSLVNLGAQIHQWFRSKALTAYRPLLCLQGGLMVKDGAGILLVDPGFGVLPRLVTGLLELGYRWGGAGAVPLDRATLVSPIMADGLVLSEEIESKYELTDWSRLPYQRGESGARYHLYLPPAARQAREETTEIRAVFFLSDPSQSTATVSPLGPGEALKQLLSSTAFLDSPMGLDDVTRLVTWIERREYFDLGVADSRETALVVDALSA